MVLYNYYLTSDRKTKLFFIFLTCFSPASFTSMLFLCCAGFEKRQAELIVSALVTLTTANMDIVYKDMVTKAHQVGP